jgi:hypothetical protein
MTINLKFLMNVAFAALVAAAGCSREQSGDACCKECKANADAKAEETAGEKVSAKAEPVKVVLNSTESLKELHVDETYNDNLKKVTADVNDAVGRIGDELQLKRQELEKAKAENAAPELVASLESDVKALTEKHENAVAERSRKMMEFVRRKHQEALQKK